MPEPHAERAVSDMQAEAQEVAAGVARVLTPAARNVFNRLIGDPQRVEDLVADVVRKRRALSTLTRPPMEGEGDG